MRTLALSCLVLSIIGAIVVWLTTHNTFLATLCLVLQFPISLIFLLVRPRNDLAPLAAWIRRLQSNNFTEPTLPVASDTAEFADALRSLATSLKSSHELLLRTQNATRAALNALPDPVALLTADGTIELVNIPAQNLFGLTPGTAARDAGKKWLPPLLDEVRRTRKPATSPAPAIQVFDNGRERLFQPHAVPILDPDQKIVGITLVLVDATASRLADEAKSGLLGRVSHELKTPLTSIQMALHLLAEDPSLPPRQHDLLKTACEDAERLHSLIQKHLDSARGENQEPGIK